MSVQWEAQLNDEIAKLNSSKESLHSHNLVDSALNSQFKKGSKLSLYDNEKHLRTASVSRKASTQSSKSVGGPQKNLSQENLLAIDKYIQRRLSTQLQENIDRLTVQNRKFSTISNTSGDLPFSQRRSRSQISYSSTSELSNSPSFRERRSQSHKYPCQMEQQNYDLILQESPRRRSSVKVTPV